MVETVDDKSPELWWLDWGSVWLPTTELTSQPHEREVGGMGMEEG